MTTKRKPSRKQTDAEMGALMREFLQTYHAPFRRGYSDTSAVYDAMNRFVVTCQGDETAAGSYIRLANRMAREDKEKRR